MDVTGLGVAGCHLFFFFFFLCIVSAGHHVGNLLVSSVSMSLFFLLHHEKIESGNTVCVDKSQAPLQDTRVK